MYSAPPAPLRGLCHRTQAMGPVPIGVLGASQPPRPPPASRRADMIRRVAEHQPHLLAETAPPLPLPSSGQNQRDFSALRKSDKGFSPAPRCLCEEARR